MFVNSISPSSSLPTTINIYFPVHFPSSWPRKTWKCMYAIHEHTNPDSQIPSGEIHLFIWALSFPQKQQQISFLRLGEICTKRLPVFYWLLVKQLMVMPKSMVDAQEGWNVAPVGVLVVMMMKEIWKWMHVVRRHILNVCVLCVILYHFSKEIHILGASTHSISFLDMSSSTRLVFHYFSWLLECFIIKKCSISWWSLIRCCAVFHILVIFP